MIYDGIFAETTETLQHPWGADVAESVGVKIQRPGDGRSGDFPTRKPTIHIVTFNYGNMEYGNCWF